MYKYIAVIIIIITDCLRTVVLNWIVLQLFKL